jgi:hypothetical protein
VLSYSYPHSLLFIVLGRLWEIGVSTAGMELETTREHHVAADHWRPQGWFDQPVGSTDPLWAPVAVCFLQVAIRWVPQGGSRCLCGLEVVWMPRWAIGSM